MDLQKESDQKITLEYLVLQKMTTPFTHLTLFNRKMAQNTTITRFTTKQRVFRAKNLAKP